MRVALQRRAQPGGPDWRGGMALWRGAIAAIARVAACACNRRGSFPVLKTERAPPPV